MRRTKMTPPELARQWGVGSDKILNFIKSGELRAIDASSRRGGRPRYLIDVSDVAKFEAAREVCPTTSRPSRRRKPTSGVVEFF